MREETEFKDKVIEDLGKKLTYIEHYQQLQEYTYISSKLGHLPELICWTTNQISAVDRRYTVKPR